MQNGRSDKTPQLERFKRVARELQCDDDEQRFAERVRKVAGAKPVHLGSKGRSGTSLTLAVDASGLEAALTEAAVLLQSFPEVAKKLFGFGDPLAELVRFDSDIAAAAGTGELVVRLEPSDLLLRHLATLRARDVDLSAIE